MLYDFVQTNSQFARQGEPVLGSVFSVKSNGKRLFEARDCNASAINAKNKKPLLSKLRVG